MKKIKCWYCKKEIKKNSKKCPYCKKEFKTMLGKVGNLKLPLIVFFSLLLITIGIVLSQFVGDIISPNIMTGDWFEEEITVTIVDHLDDDPRVKEYVEKWAKTNSEDPAVTQGRAYYYRVKVAQPGHINLVHGNREFHSTGRELEIMHRGSKSDLEIGKTYKMILFRRDSIFNEVMDFGTPDSLTPRQRATREKSVSNAIFSLIFATPLGFFYYSWYALLFATLMNPLILVATLLGPVLAYYTVRKVERKWKILLAILITLQYWVLVVAIIQVSGFLSNLP